MTSKISPVSVLSEMMTSKNATPPQYLFCEEADGKFVCTVLVDGESASAVSTSKRLAKRESARILLQKLLSHTSFPQASSTPDQTPTALNDCSLKQTKITKMNSKTSPTSVLHELMIAKKKPVQYSYAEEGDGKIKCTVLLMDGTSASAVSTSKKIAKYESARIILEKLKLQKPSSQPASTQKQTKSKDSTTKQAQVTSNKIDSKLSPASILHELMTSKKIPQPIYKYAQIYEYSEEISDGKIKCTVLVDGKSASAVSTSKKLAKNESARKMLQKLMSQKSSQAASTQKETKSKDSTKQPQSATTRNYIGELNEFSSKQKAPLPVYEFWPVTTSVDGDVYIVSCTFMEHQALGKGKNKKEAKQNAARNMLELYLKDIKSEPSSSKAKAKTKTSKTGNKALDSVDQKCETNVGKNAVAAKYLEDVISQISTLSTNKQTQKDGQGPSPIQIVINFPN